MKEYKGEFKLLLLAVLFFNGIFFAISLKDHTDLLNRKLEKVALLIEDTIPQSHLERAARGEELPADEVEFIFRKLSKYTASEELKFTYVIVDTPTGMKYIFGGIPLEIFQEGNYLDYYLYDVKIDEDTVYHIKEEMIAGNRANYTGSYRDAFGEYKAHINAYTTRNGTVVLAGAEYDLTEYKRFIILGLIRFFIVNTIILTGVLLLIFSIYKKHSKERHQIIREGMTDQLTGLYTRKALSIIRKHLDLVPATLWVFAYFDLDGLKKVNDSMGHKEGDRYITNFSSVLKKVFRHEDILMRLGGDEFLAVADISKKENMHLIEKRLYIEAKKSKVEFSMGYLLRKTHDIRDIEKIIKAADERMYKEKQKKKAERKD